MPNPAGLLDVVYESVTTLRRVANSLAVHTALQLEELKCQKYRRKKLKT